MEEMTMKTDYITASTTLPPYLAYPRFLLERFHLLPVLLRLCPGVLRRLIGEGRTRCHDT